MASVQMGMVIPVDLAVKFDKEREDIPCSVAMRYILQYLMQTPGTINGIVKNAARLEQ